MCVNKSNKIYKSLKTNVSMIHNKVINQAEFDIFSGHHFIYNRLEIRDFPLKTAYDKRLS